MKKLAFLIGFIACILINTSNAQQEVRFVKNPGNENFVGKWKWVNQNESLEIVLEEQENVKLSENTKANLIIGFIKYIKNGATIQNTLGSLGSSYEDKKYSLSGNARDSTLFRSTLYDEKKKKAGRLYLTLSPDKKTVEWKLSDPPGGYIVGTREEGFSFPLNLVLTKQDDEKQFYKEL